MTVCEDCAWLDYDEERDEYVCGQDLDEDEYAALLDRRSDACPFYRPGDPDYILSGKQ